MAISAPASMPSSLALVASDRRPAPCGVDAVALDRPRRGTVAARPRPGVVRRAESSPCGPLILEARRDGDAVCLEVWGQPGVLPDVAERALGALAAWVGLLDDAEGFADAVASHPTLRELLRRLGEVRLSRLPRVGEAVGRAILGQLVQSVEAERSTAQFVAMAGAAASGGLWCWPTPGQVSATPSWALRRCGVSLRSARALHAAASCNRRLEEARSDWALLDRRLRALPGIGAWTSGEARLSMGDPDAVPVGDWGLPSIIGCALGDRPRSDWDDAQMLELLAPFVGHRGRVIALVKRAMSRGLIDGPRRRAPRAALSAHRYW